MIQAEQSVIGSMLLDESCVDSVLNKLNPGAFQNEIARTVFEVIAQLRFERKPIDAVIVASCFGGSDRIKQFLLDCMTLTPTASNVMEYADIVLDEARRRKVRDIASRLLDGDDAGQCAADLIAVDSGKTKETVSGQEWANSFANAMMQNINDPDCAFCKTGFRDIDNVLGGGLIKGGVYIVGARPGMGKTTFALNIAENIVKRNQTVLFISLEMSPFQIMCKRISMVGSVLYNHVLTGKLDKDEQSKAFQTLERIQNRPFVTNTEFALTVSDIGNIARRVQDCACVIVDYFGLITSPDNGKGGSRYEIYSDISRQLKQLAGTLNVPILCLAQLNREVERGRADKKPQLADLRDTGSLEQDADAVIFLHRDGYYNRDDDDEDRQKTIDIIVRKNRHGDCGEVQMAWFGKYGEIFEIEKGKLPF